MNLMKLTWRKRCWKTRMSMADLRQISANGRMLARTQLVVSRFLPLCLIASDWMIQKLADWASLEAGQQVRQAVPPPRKLELRRVPADQRVRQCSVVA